MTNIVKKTAAVLAAAMLLAGMTACGTRNNSSSSSSTSSSSSSSSAPSSSTSTADSMSLTDIMAAILDGVEELPKAENTELTGDNIEGFLFVKPEGDYEALASEALVSAQAHSVVLLRLPESADAGSVADEIRNNANPRKWICVEAEKTEVTVHGSTILLVMSSTAAADAITANFDALYK